MAGNRLRRDVDVGVFVWQMKKTSNIALSTGF
jgi:hypothetical protein